MLRNAKNIFLRIRKKVFGIRIFSSYTFLSNGFALIPKTNVHWGDWALQQRKMLRRKWKEEKVNCEEKENNFQRNRKTHTHKHTRAAAFWTENFFSFFSGWIAHHVRCWWLAVTLFCIECQMRWLCVRWRWWWCWANGTRETMRKQTKMREQTQKCVHNVHVAYLPVYSYTELVE